MTTKELHITAQVTPNPNTLKFVLNLVLIPQGSINFTTAKEGSTSPLVKALFEIEGITNVMIGTNFVSITKDKAVDWSDVAEALTVTIRGTVESEKTLIDEKSWDTNGL